MLFSVAITHVFAVGTYGKDRDVTICASMSKKLDNYGKQ